MLLTLLLALLASVAVAQDWGKMATISSTMGVSASRLCLGEASRGDIGCPSYAPYVSSNGYVGIGTSSPSATLHVSGDFIVTTSNTSVPALYVSNSIAYVGIGTNSPQNSLDIRPNTTSTDGFVNVKTSKGSTFFNAYQFGATFASSNPMFNAMSDNGTSPTSNFYYRGTTSGTTNFSVRADGTVYMAGKVAIGTNNYLNTSTWNPSANLEVSGTISATHFVGDGSGLTGLGAAGSSDRITSGTTSMLAISSTGYVSLTQSGVNTGWFDPAYGLVTIGVSSTGAISGTNGWFTGTLRSTGNLTVGGGIFLPSNYIYWNNGNYASIGATSTPDLRISVSNTEAMRIVSSGYVGIGTSTPSTTLTVYSNTIQNLARFTSSFNNQATISFIAGASGVPVYTGSPGSTGGFAIWDGSGPGANNQLFSVTDAGKIGIGKSVYAPSATLHVSGTARITSWTAIAANVTPSAALDVYGTISATNFVGNGSGLTGIASTGDRIVSGSTNMVAEQTSGTVRVSGTLAMVNTGNEVCNAATWYSFRVNPSTGMMQMCRP